LCATVGLSLSISVKLEFRLRTWLILLLATAVVLTFSIVGTAILVFRLPQVEERGRLQAQTAAEGVSRLLDQFMGGVEEQLIPLTGLLENRSAEEIHDVVEAIVADGTTFDAISIIDIDGSIKAVGLPRGRRAATAALRGLDLSANRLLLSVRQEAGAMVALPVKWSDRYLSVLSGETTVGVALHAGRYTVIGELSQSRLLDMLHSFTITDEVVIGVADGKGWRLATNRPDRGNDELKHFDFSTLPSYRAVVANAPLPSYEVISGKRFLVGAVVSPKLGWVIGASVPAGWDNYSYRTTIILVCIGFIASLLISLSLAPFWAARMVRPVRGLINHAHRIAARNYPEAPLNRGSVWELNTLAVDLDLMGRAIREREEGMARSEERLRATLESVPTVAIQWYDVHGRVLYWNRASEAMYGFTAQEAVGTLISEHPLMYLDATQVATFINMLTSIEDSSQAFGPAEFPLRRKDGRKIIVLGTTFAIPGDQGEKFFVCMDIDITERKQAEASLQASQQKMAAIFNASPAPMTVSDVDDQYRLVDANHAWEILFARKLSGALGKNGTEMGLWVDAADRQHLVDTLDRAGAIDGQEAWLLTGDGRQVLCHISALVTQVGGQRLLLMMAVDVTEQRRIEREIRELNIELEERVERRTEELVQANEELEATVGNLKATQEQLVQSAKLAALGDLVAGVAHELNTPIGNGLMATTTLRDRLGEFQAAMAKGLRRSALDDFMAAVDMAGDITTRNLHRAADLVSSFKQLAIDQTSAQRRSFELAEVVHEVLVTLQPTLKRTPYLIETDVPVGLLFDSYPGPLGQVLTNLINNAVLHGFDNREHGTIRIEAQAIASDQVRLVVGDDGKGIPLERQQRIFEPFFTTRLGRGGSGLGLHIVFNTVTGVLGGTISLVSHESKGTDFILTLPRQGPATPSTQQDAHLL
jgi:PAS domain S-box-containing protein